MTNEGESPAASSGVKPPDQSLESAPQPQKQDESSTPPSSQEEPAYWVNNGVILPDDYFEPDEPEPWSHRSRIVVAIIAIILVISLVLYYAVPILIPVKPNPLPKESISKNEEIYYT